LKDLLLLTALSFLVLLPGLGQMKHLKSREVRHAEIIREMYESGDYFVPTLLGKEYDYKPPVFHAVGALLTRCAGAPSMTMARLPSVLAGWLAVLATCGAGRILISRTAALVGAIALLGMPGFSGMARFARPDMILCATIVLSGLGLLLGMREKRPQLRALAFALAGAMAGVGTLTKGPWGLVFPVLLALLVSFARKDWKLPKADWAWFAVCFLVVLAAWAVPVYLRDGGRYLSLMLHQPDLEVGEAPWDPMSRYLMKGLALTLPMSLFLPLAARDFWRRGYSPLLAFALVVLIMFIVIPKKRPHYLLPMYPFLALGIAESIILEGRQERWLRRAATITIGGFVIGGLLYYAFIEGSQIQSEDPDFQVARRLVNETLPGSRVYALALHGEEEALAWIGDRRIKVVDLDENQATAAATLQNAPEGSYLATVSLERTALEAGQTGPRLRLVTAVSDRKFEILLFRIVGPGE
jgi:4-amino-4-deoxy-L-arabinose transferase-like glycosyltransferase